jgi:PII-like signaling protein
VSLEGQGKLLRIFIGESDRWNHRPLYEEIVRAARERGMAGATVLRGIEGFGARSVLHTSRILRLSEDLPLVVEVVDTEEKIDAFLREIDAMIGDGLVTVERVEVRTYRAEGPPDAGAT